MGTTRGNQNSIYCMKYKIWFHQSGQNIFRFYILWQSEVERTLGRILKRDHMHLRLLLRMRFKWTNHLNTFRGSTMTMNGSLSIKPYRTVPSPTACICLSPMSITLQKHMNGPRDWVLCGCRTTNASIVWELHSNYLLINPIYFSHWKKKRKK